MSFVKEKDWKDFKRTKRYKVFIGFGLGSLLAMSSVLFFVCIMAFLNGGHVIIAIDNYGESVAEMVLMAVCLIAGALSIGLVVKHS